MKANFGAIIVDGRGKLGGHVAQKNAAGNFLRTRSIPINRQSSAQQSRRALVSELTKDWKGLTEAQRIEWNRYASSKPTQDIFGKTYVKSGMNWFVELNLNLINVGEEKDLEPGTPLVTELIFYDWGVEFAETSASSIIVIWSRPIVTGVKIILYATPSVSAGISSSGSRLRQLAVLSSTDVSPYDLTAQYKAVFGNVGAVGTKIFTKAVQIDIASGIASYPLITSGIVPEYVP